MAQELHIHVSLNEGAGGENAFSSPATVSIWFDGKDLLLSGSFSAPGSILAMHIQSRRKWPDPNKEIWVFCRTQHRATYFAGLLYQYGYRNVYLFDKGIVGWIEKGYPLVNKYLGEIKVTKYEKKLKEDYAYRENK